MENIDLHGLTSRDVIIVKALVRSLRKNPPQKIKRKINLSEFSFKKARKATKNLKGNLSDALLDEREHYL
ncbi:MAG: hypothetical protein KAR13_01145 [Desulfobulbaceae bacterium]|nr:hypothetical protein [Desulfobulbaceae bacterium]